MPWLPIGLHFTNQHSVLAGRLEMYENIHSLIGCLELRFDTQLRDGGDVPKQALQCFNGA